MNTSNEFAKEPASLSEDELDKELDRQVEIHGSYYDARRALGLPVEAPGRVQARLVANQLAQKAFAGSKSSIVQR